MKSNQLMLVFLLLFIGHSEQAHLPAFQYNPHSLSNTRLFTSEFRSARPHASIASPIIFNTDNEEEEQLKNLKFLRDRFQEYVDTANISVKLELVQELRAYKRKWIKAFETECELAETAAQNSVKNNAVPREVEETITEIDTATTEVEDCLEEASGAATVEQTVRFSE